MGPTISLSSPVAGSKYDNFTNPESITYETFGILGEQDVRLTKYELGWLRNNSKM